MERNIGKIRGRGSFKIWPRERLRGPENEIHFYSMCARELNLSSLFVGDDSTAKTTTKNTFWFSWSAMLAVTPAVISNCHGNGAGR